MRRASSISLLLVLFISIFPWEALDLCPNKNGHHSEDEMHHGNCADGMMDDHESGDSSEIKEQAQTGFSFRGPSCTTIAPAVDSYNTGQALQAPAIQQLAVLVILFDWLSNAPEYQQAFYPAPEFLNKSGPPATVNPLRGPPIFS
jgi:hypothetical protein